MRPVWKKPPITVEVWTVEVVRTDRLFIEALEIKALVEVRDEEIKIVEVSAVPEAVVKVRPPVSVPPVS